jgi:hypothetical protein
MTLQDEGIRKFCKELVRKKILCLATEAEQEVLQENCRFFCICRKCANHFGSVFPFQGIEIFHSAENVSSV